MSTFTESATIWREIFDASFDGLWVADGDGKTLFVNKKYTELTGVQEKDVLGRSADQLVKEGILRKSAIPDVIETGEPKTVLNHMINRYLLVTGVPVFDDKNKIKMVVCNCRDITHLTELQNDIERKEQLLKQYEMAIHQYQNILSGTSGGPIIQSECMSRLYEMASYVATSSSTVLILGESGVGKEVLAKWIHENSPRNNKPFILVNCAAFPENLIESELFGYEQGAFTGAVKARAGLFESADKGTIFLDEVGELSLNMQAKLLRVLEEREIRRIGSSKNIKIDVRIITATNRDLLQMIEEKTFREDLYYRLDVISFTIPPLRERVEEIPFLIERFSNKFGSYYGKDIKLSPQTIKTLCKYSWPGNIRELNNIIERLVVMSRPGSVINELDLPPYLRGFQYEQNTSQSLIEDRFEPQSLQNSIESFEKDVILEALSHSTSIRDAARRLQIDHTVLLRRMKKYELKFMK